ncbi:MAG: YcfL family protein [Lentisphaerota bacterium]
MRKSILVALSAFTIAILAGGCSTSVMDIDGSAGGAGTVNYKNSPVDITVLDTRSRFVNDLLQVNMELENGISNTYELEYKFSWYDSGGMEVDPGRSAWIPINLKGKETKTIQGLAPNPSAKSFKIKIREADSSNSVFHWNLKPLF